MADKEIVKETSKEETSKEEIQYANFGDMGKSELPDEIEETPADNNLAIDYIEEPPEETVETGTPEETSETNVKGEILTPEQETYWQHKFDTEAKPLKEQNELLRQELESIKTQLNPPLKEEVLVEPVAPTTDDPNEWVDYHKLKIAYDNKVHKKEMSEMKGVIEQFQSVMTTQAEAEKANQLKSYQLGKLQTVGKLTPEESVGAINMFSNPSQTEEEYFGYIADYYRFRKGKSTPSKIVIPKTPAPLATVTGETQEVKGNDDDQFFGDMKEQIKKHY